MSTVQLDNVSKHYGDHQALKQTTLTINKGEFFTLLGPSGCGKTTTLRLIAGLMQPSSGRILIGDMDVTGVPIQKRNVGIVFQGYALFPHMTVLGNVAFGLQERRWKKPAIKKRVQEMLELVELQDQAHKYPRQLSGGQQQRVGLARALAAEPSVLLLDEPLGALDLKLRESLQLEIVRVHRELGTTTVYVTHDQHEALRMSDKIAVVNGGEILQCDAPATIYDEPRHEFVASFIGKTNILYGTVTSTGGEVVEVEVGTARTPLKAALPKGSAAAVGSSVAVAVRPEAIRITQATSGEVAQQDQLRGKVTDVSYLGNVTQYEVEVGLDGQRFMVEHADRFVARVGDHVSLGWATESGRVLDRHEA